MKRILLSLVFSQSLFFGFGQVILYQSFDFLEGIVGDENYDWKLLNVSNPIGTVSNESWFQADGTMGINAYMGLEPNCYVQADRYVTSAVTGGTISNWLISPVIILSDGDSVRFHTISYDNINRPDKIEIRVSTLGENSVLPTSATEAGSFNILIGVINADLTTTGFPCVQNGQTWTRYSFPVAGINFGNDCRVAIRYFVPNSGLQGPNGSAVGIDEFYITGPDGFINVDENSSKESITIYPNPASDFIRISSSNNSSICELEVLDMSGRNVYSAIVNTLSAQIDVSFLNTGFYLIKSKTTSGKILNTKFLKK